MAIGGCFRQSLTIAIFKKKEELQCDVLICVHLNIFLLLSCNYSYYSVVTINKETFITLG